MEAECQTISQQDSPLLYIVIPCYNEEAVLPMSKEMFKKKLYDLMERGLVSPDSRIMFVNDGSKDGTWQLIENLCAEDQCFCGISLSRNRGHQNALLAGLMEARNLCDVSISIDCDGQDDINAMDKMIEAYRSGCDVVYGVRSDRSSDTFFKRTSAQAFYKLLSSMGVETVYNHADYRLLSVKVLNELAQFKEVNLFLRGMIPLIGFKSTSVAYERHERIAGESHYPLSKMVGLAVDGITSLSVKPIRVVTLAGAVVAFLGFMGILWAVINALLQTSVAGWSSTVAIVCFLGGVQLLAIGVLGEYIGKIYMEVKRRPRYIVSDRVGRNLGENQKR